MPPKINGFNYVFTFPSNINTSRHWQPGPSLLGLCLLQLCAHSLPGNVQPCMTLQSQALQGNLLNPLAQDQVLWRSMGEGKVETMVLSIHFTLMRWMGVTLSSTDQNINSESFPLPSAQWATPHPTPEGSCLASAVSHISQLCCAGLKVPRPLPHSELGQVGPGLCHCACPAGISEGSHQIPQTPVTPRGEQGSSEMPPAPHTCCKSEYYPLHMMQWALSPHCRGLPGDVTRGGQCPCAVAEPTRKGQVNPLIPPCAGQPAAMASWQSWT